MTTQEPLLTKVALPTARWRSIAPAALLILLCLFFSSLRWLKIESFWGDSSRWIFEAWRAASGELPYRDFAWQYPPLSLLLFGGAFRTFGASFATAQIAVDILSAAIILLTWGVARRLLPPVLSFGVAATLACAGAGNTGNFALFSLQIYTPAVLVGMVGLLMILNPLISRVQSGSLETRSRVLLSAGATIALLSKPEFAMGAVGALAAAAIVDLRVSLIRGGSPWAWLREQSSIVAWTTIPALIIYGVLAWKAGTRNLLTGITGYGMAYTVCPWWPTGLGIFGAAVALLQAASVLAVAEWLYRKKSRHPAEGTRIALWIAAALAIPATILYVPYCVRELHVFAGGISLVRIASFFLSTGTVLLPVMWSSIVLWFVLALNVARGRALSPNTAVLLILSSSALLMSIRTLFGGTLSQLTLVTVAAYPIWFILAPWLMERFLFGAELPPFRRAPAAVVGLLAVYGLLRFGAAVVAERPSHYVVLETAAGPVRLLDRSASADVYRYVVQHTSSADPVLDTAYGGAVNFAGRRASPIYSTQFSGLAPSQKYLDLDLERIRAHPPALVIADLKPDLGASYGLCAETGCMFPALVWRSKRLACDPGRNFPVLEFIKQNYAPVARFGEKTIYAQKPTLLTAL